MAATARERGNELFRRGLAAEAAGAYTEALGLVEAETAEGTEKAEEEKKTMKATLYKNRAACRIKLHAYEDALADATAALELTPGDAKAMYRQACALEELSRLDEAHTVLRRVLVVEPGNGEATAAIQRVMARRADEAAKAREAAKASSHVDELVAQCKDLSALSTGKAAAEKISAAIHDAAFVKKLANGRHIRTLVKALVDVTKDSGDGADLAAALVHAFSVLAVDPYVGESIAVELTDDAIARLTKGAKPSFLTGVIGLMATLAMHAGRPDPEEEKRQSVHIVAPDGAAAAANAIPRVPVEQRPNMALFVRVPQQAMNVFLPAMRSNANEAVQTAAIQGLIKVVGNKSAAAAFLDGPAFPALLAVCRTRGSKTQSLLSVALARIFEAAGSQQSVIKLEMDNDAERTAALIALATICQADPEVGASILLQDGVLEELLDSYDIDGTETKIALMEMFAQACADKSCRSAIGLKGGEILRVAVVSSDVRLMVRAAVALSKTAFVDVNERDKVLKESDVAERIFKVLADPKQPADVRVWAVEGTAYLSIFSEYKDRIATDAALLDSLFSLVKLEDSALQYGITTILANMTAYRRKLNEEEEQLKKLKEFAGEKQPKAHPADADANVARRASAVLRRGAVTALVALVKAKANKSANVAESMASILLNLAVDQANRGTMVQQGAATVLLPLANEGTKNGMNIAAQALAKMAITMDPALAFKGQKSAELIRPLVRLLQSEDGLQNFEALMALTNLTSSSDELQERLLHEDGLHYIENLMFNDNELIKRAATETFCNMSQHPDVIAKFDKAANSDRVRILLALADMPDFATRRAASGSLAILTGSSKTVCQQILSEKHGIPILVTLLNDAAHAQLTTEERQASRAAATATAAGDVEDDDEDEDDDGDKDGAQTGDQAAAAPDDPDAPAVLTPQQGLELQHRAVTVLSNMAEVPEVAKGIVAAGLLPVIEMLQYATFAPVAAAAKAALEHLTAAAP